MPKKSKFTFRPKNELESQIHHLCSIGDLDSLKAIYSFDNLHMPKNIIYYATAAVINKHMYIVDYFRIALNDSNYGNTFTRSLIYHNKNNTDLIKHIIDAGAIMPHQLVHVAPKAAYELYKDEKYKYFFTDASELLSVNCRAGNYDIVKHMIENISKNNPENKLDCDDSCICTLTRASTTVRTHRKCYAHYLISAVQGASVKLCKYLIEEKNALKTEHYKNYFGTVGDKYPPLIWHAIAYNRIDIIVYLLSIGYDENEKDNGLHALYDYQIAPLLNLGVDLQSLFIKHKISDECHISKKVARLTKLRSLRQKEVTDIALSCTNLIKDTLPIIMQYIEY